MIVRDATEADLAAIVDIYNEVVATTAAIWRDDPVTIEDRTSWFHDRRAGGHPVLVAVDEDDAAEGAADHVVGFGTFGDFRPFPGYHVTVEHSIHVRRDRRGTGVGQALMGALIERARAQGKAVMVAGIDAGNVGSIRFHERFGFSEVGRMPGIGRKLGEPVDLVLMQCSLLTPDE